MNFKALLEAPEYRFLKEDPRLGDKIILLGVSGSYGYGTNCEGSDIDLRGVTLNAPSDLIGLTSYELFENRATDTVIYSFMKIVNLLMSCNPNTIEILGLDEDQYLIKTEIGQELVENRKLFLSKRAIYTFGNYARNQFRRLGNSLAQEESEESQMEEQILESARHVIEVIREKIAGKGEIDARLYTEETVTGRLPREISLDLEGKGIPLRWYQELMNSLGSVVTNYERDARKGHGKKDEPHLNKHAMHLVRLYMMGVDILSKGEIITHRPPEDLKILRSIRAGDYMEHGKFVPAFYELEKEYRLRFEEAKKKTRLPDTPDMEAIGRFVEKVNRRVVTENI